MRRLSRHREPGSTRSGADRSPRRAGGREPSGQRKRRLSGHREPSLTGVRQVALFGASRAEPRPGQGTRTSSERWAPIPPGQGKRRSLEHRASGPPETRKLDPLRRMDGPVSTPARVSRLNGAAPRPGRGSSDGALRSAASSSLTSGQGTRTSSEQWAPHPTRNRAGGALRSIARLVPPGTGNPDLFGGSAPGLVRVRMVMPYRDRASGALRSIGCSVSSGWVPAPRGWAIEALRSVVSLASPGRGVRSSSEHRAPCSTGQEDRTSSEGRPLRLARGRETPPHRGLVSGAPRSTARRTSRGYDNRGSSEHRASAPTGTGSPKLFGGTVTSSRSRQGQLVSSENRVPGPSGQGRPVDHGREQRVYVARLGERRSARRTVSAGTHAGQDGNGRKATAAVMRCGC
jgi:hypothetical protein